MARSFTLFESVINCAYEMQDEDRHSFMDALIRYAVTGEVPEDMTPTARLVFIAVEPFIEQSMAIIAQTSTGGAR